MPLPHALTIFHFHERQKESKGKKKKKKKKDRTDFVYDGVELGLVSCSEEDIESSLSKLDRELAPDAV